MNLLYLLPALMLLSASEHFNKVFKPGPSMPAIPTYQTDSADTIHNKYVGFALTKEQRNMLRGFNKKV